MVILEPPFLLPACNISIESIIAAIEKWWWPLFIDQEYRDQIEISVFDLNGKKIIINPERQDEINPFISAARNLKENFSHPGKAKTQQIKIIPKNKQEFPGKLSCLKRPKNSTNQLDNKLAIIRNNLVIEYNEKYFRKTKLMPLECFMYHRKQKLIEL